MFCIFFLVEFVSSFQFSTKSVIFVGVVFSFVQLLIFVVFRFVLPTRLNERELSTCNVCEGCFVSLFLVVSGVMFSPPTVIIRHLFCSFQCLLVSLRLLLAYVSFMVLQVKPRVTDRQQKNR